MKDGIIQKLKESVFSILPVMVIIFLVLILLKTNIMTIISLFISTILLIFGICLFTYGAELSMVDIGKTMGSRLVKTKNPFLIGFISFIVGIIITVAEPDLKVLASQMTAINDYILIISVGIGVGIFLCIATLRIIYQIDLKILLMIFYSLILILMFFISEGMIPVAFDSGGVTTGPMSVPFIMSLGLGFSSSRSSKESKDDSFGLIALCSIGPIITVLLLSLFIKSDMSYTYNISEEITNLHDLIFNYISYIIPTLKEVALSLIPILALFIIFNLITKSIQGIKLKKIFVGLFITYIGLSLFFIGVNAGYMKIAYLIGINMYKNYELLLIPLGIIIGLVIVKAEPAVAVLTEQIEEMTNGNMKKKIMNSTIAFGVAIAIGISMLRVLTGISIIPFLIVGYILAIVLMLVSPKLFTMVAFDSGGAVSGPMTTSFLLPLIIGVCYASGGNVLTEAFGLVALVALSPLLTIQILGVIYNIKSSRKTRLYRIDESIIDYDWGNING